MITSAQNSKLKLVRALLGRAKERRAESAFVAEGVRLEDGPAKCERVEDGGGDEVELTFVDGRCTQWQLRRHSAAEITAGGGASP